MNIFHAIILGLVQGLTEFLPISSSAHLFLLPDIFGWQYQGIGFDVALHWGTLLSVLVIFGRDYWRYLKAFLASLFRPPMAVASGQTLANQVSPEDKRMAWFLVIATIPAAAFGYLFESQVETVFRNPWVTVSTLIVFAFLLLWADRFELKRQENFNGLSWKKSLAIGLAQAVALVPGVSRSGVTMTAGMFAGLSRQAAARFSFLLLGPIAFGAGLVTLSELDGITAALVAGFIAAAISGYLAVKFLLSFVSTHSYGVFVWYRIILALGVAVILLIR